MSGQYRLGTNPNLGAEYWVIAPNGDVVLSTRSHSQAVQAVREWNAMARVMQYMAAA